LGKAAREEREREEERWRERNRIGMMRRRMEEDF